ncbi:MAG: hypothetical protein VXW22_16990, partial [Pseudomonadota bacterium]|nr:hypothetical protein [Pseudomonadota bacterium]
VMCVASPIWRQERIENILLVFARQAGILSEILRKYRAIEPESIKFHRIPRLKFERSGVFYRQ